MLDKCAQLVGAKDEWKNEGFVRQAGGVAGWPMNAAIGAGTMPATYMSASAVAR